MYYGTYAGMGRARSESHLHASSYNKLDIYAEGYALKKTTSSVMAEFFYKEPCLYGPNAFRRAADLVEALQEPGLEDSQTHRKDKRSLASIPDVRFNSEKEKREILRLVFSSLKYRKFLEDMLDKCSFYSQYPEYRDDPSLVLVVLCDYRQRKFQVRSPLLDETPDPYLMGLERALLKAKTKLNAALARNRIKNNVWRVENLLPDGLRQHEINAQRMYVTCWVNQLKTSVDTVLDKLHVEGFMQKDSGVEMLHGKDFYKDRHCRDVLCFSAEQRSYFERHALVKDGLLVIQDKCACVGVQSVRNLLEPGDDVLLVGGGTCLIAAHLASLTRGTDSVIYMFGAQSDAVVKQANQTLQTLNAKSRVNVVSMNFTDVDASDEKLKNIKVLLVMAPCTKSGVTNPVELIVDEGEDMMMLKDLSLGKPPDARISEYASRSATLLKHALKFSRAQTVVYVTRSVHKAENESVVTRCIEHSNANPQRKAQWKLSAPVLPLSHKDMQTASTHGGKCLLFPADHTSSGSFVAVMTKEAEDHLATANDFFARARAIGGVVKTTAPPPPVETDEDEDANRRKKKGKIIMMKRKESIGASSSGPMGSRRQSMDVVQSVSESPHDQAVSSPASRKKSKKMGLFARKPSIDARAHYYVKPGSDDPMGSKEEVNPANSESLAKRQVALTVHAFPPPSPLEHSTSHAAQHPVGPHLSPHIYHPTTTHANTHTLTPHRTPFHKALQLHCTSYDLLHVHNDPMKNTSGYQASLLTRPPPESTAEILKHLLEVRRMKKQEDNR